MLDTNVFEPAESRWQDIYKHLTAAGFEVYPPATKVGECTSRYIVVTNNGSTRHAAFSTDIDLYSVMVYVPRTAYSQLEVTVQEVKRAMKGLAPMITPYGYQSPSFYDESVKAHMVSIDYKNYKKML